MREKESGESVRALVCVRVTRTLSDLDQFSNLHDLESLKHLKRDFEAGKEIAIVGDDDAGILCYSSFVVLKGIGRGCVCVCVRVDSV